ncbi:MAG: phosphonate metabolism protein/1,5-bisphosphokinase (PRPP-forming) PhnN [Rhodobacteraceae bacterium]|nr:phosphonate metabolism protein/1,5-bisphosphokinase (PRPP-forming) PhnN [Paracoccaceae bacterium]
MTGRLIAVVGPSGVGKDSVMARLAEARPDIVLARRVITRAADAGGENFTPVSVAAFDRMREAGDFMLCWGAHGLFYGVPRSCLDCLRQGATVLVNLSRGVLAEAQAQWPELEVIHLTATPAALARRLHARGRETADDVQRRLSRAAEGLPPGLHRVHVIDNSGALDMAVAAALAALYPARV